MLTLKWHLPPLRAEMSPTPGNSHSVKRKQNTSTSPLTLYWGENKMNMEIQEKCWSMNGPTFAGEYLMNTMKTSHSTALHQRKSKQQGAPQVSRGRIESMHAKGAAVR